MIIGPAAAESELGPSDMRGGRCSSCSTGGVAATGKQEIRAVRIEATQCGGRVQFGVGTKRSLPIFINFNIFLIVLFFFS